MYMNLDTLKNKQSELILRCKSIVDSCKSEVREMTEDEKTEFEANKEEIKAIREQLNELQGKIDDYERELPKEEEEEDDKKEDPKEDEKDDKKEDTKEEEEDDKKDDPKEDEKEDKKEDPKEDEDTKEEDPEEDEKEDNINKRNITMEKKFNLMKELRNSLETGKSFNLNEIRAYTVNDEGEDVVQTDIYDIWGPLRAKNVLVQAGAQYITGIKNNIQIPLMSGVTCSFEGETDAASDGSGAFTHQTLSPKRITAKYPISLQLLAQDSIGVEAKIREDIINAVNAKLESVLLGSAAGTTTKPAGIFYNQTPAVITDFAGITALEAGVETNNVFGEMKYVMSPAAKGDLRAMSKSTKSTQLVMENGNIDGTDVLATSHVADKNIVYGDFSNLVIATWDNVQIDVVRDVQSVGNGQVTIVVNAYVDGAVIRPAAFAFATTATA